MCKGRDAELCAPPRADIDFAGAWLGRTRKSCCLGERGHPAHASRAVDAPAGGSRGNVQRNGVANEARTEFCARWARATGSPQHSEHTCCASPPATAFFPLCINPLRRRALEHRQSPKSCSAAPPKNLWTLFHSQAFLPASAMAHMVASTASVPRTGPLAFQATRPRAAACAAAAPRRPLAEPAHRRGSAARAADTSEADTSTGQQVDELKAPPQVQEKFRCATAWHAPREPAPACTALLYAFVQSKLQPPLTSPLRIAAWSFPPRTCSRRCG